jgi:hypothetical protein
MTFNPKELITPPKSWCRWLGEVVYEVENEHGGYASFPSRFDGEVMLAEKHALIAR